VFCVNRGAFGFFAEGSPFPSFTGIFWGRDGFSIALSRIFHGVVFLKEVVYDYKAKKWNRARKVIVQAKQLPDSNNFLGKENTQYIVPGE